MFGWDPAFQTFANWHEDSSSGRHRSCGRDADVFHHKRQDVRQGTRSFAIRTVKTHPRWSMIDFLARHRFRARDRNAGSGRLTLLSTDGGKPAASRRRID